VGRGNRFANPRVCGVDGEQVVGFAKPSIRGGDVRQFAGQVLARADTEPRFHSLQGRKEEQDWGN